MLTFKSRGVEQEELAFLRGELQDTRFIIEAKDGQNKTLLFDDSEKKKEGDMEVSTGVIKSGLIDFDDIFVEEENKNAELSSKSKKRLRVGESCSSSSATAVLAAFGSDSTARMKKEKSKIVAKIVEATSTAFSSKSLLPSADTSSGSISHVNDCTVENKDKKGKINKVADVESAVSSISLPVLSLFSTVQSLT